MRQELFCKCIKVLCQIEMKWKVGGTKSFSSDVLSDCQTPQCNLFGFLIGRKKKPELLSSIWYLAKVWCVFLSSDKCMVSFCGWRLITFIWFRFPVLVCWTQDAENIKWFVATSCPLSTSLIWLTKEINKELSTNSNADGKGNLYRTNLIPFLPS